MHTNELVKNGPINNRLGASTPVLYVYCTVRSMRKAVNQKGPMITCKSIRDRVENSSERH